MTIIDLVEVSTRIRDLNAVSSGASNAKTALLDTIIDDASFKYVFSNAYNHLKTSGISDRTVAKVEEVASETRGEGESLSPELQAKVVMCQNRQISGAGLISFLTECRESLCFEAYEVLTNMLIGDMRCGITATALNGLRPGYVPSFKVQLSHKFEEKRIKSFPVAVETKYDGVRCIAYLSGGTAKLFSRTGKLLKGDFPKIVEQLNEVAKSAVQVYGEEAIVVDGEIMDAVAGFNETVGAVHRKSKNTNVSLFLFDIMSASDFEQGKCVYTYHARRRVLSKIIADAQLGDLAQVVLSDGRICNSMDEIYQVNAEVMDSGGEGVIVKPLDGKYEFKRSFHWMKVKAKNTLDLVVVDWAEGTGRIRGMLGAFVVDHSGVYVNVGSGLSDGIREYFKGKEDTCKGLLVEVEFHEETPDGSLRHPRFKSFRSGELATNPKSIEDGPGC